ncbi:MAG: DegT/DnrJ/EryC1/StrS family aminotransferase [Candidatus Omnitrophota bacterium]
MIQVAKPLIGQAELENIRPVLESGWLGMGQNVFEFENLLKKMFNRKHAIAVNTGTAAIHIALASLGIGRGDEVIVPSQTFAGTIQPILLCGAKPVFCDIGLDDLNMDVGHMKKLITGKTKVILPVHYGGSPCRMDEILKIARKRGIHVVEDAAHAFGSSYKGRLVGSFGDITCFSFDPIKNITCGEGGVVILDDEKTAQTVIMKRILGIDKDTWNRYKHQRSWFYEVRTTGFRYHMSNISAAIGLVQLGKFAEMAATRRGIARFYDAEFAGLDSVKSLNHDYDAIVPFNYTIMAEDRDNLMDHLNKKGVGTVINYIPNHIQPLFRGRKTKLPNTDLSYKKIVSIPLHAALTMDDARFVARAIKEFYGKRP